MIEELEISNEWIGLFRFPNTGKSIKPYFIAYKLVFFLVSATTLQADGDEVATIFSSLIFPFHVALSFYGSRECRQPCATIFNGLLQFNFLVC